MYINSPWTAKTGSFIQAGGDQGEPRRRRERSDFLRPSFSARRATSACEKLSVGYVSKVPFVPK